MRRGALWLGFGAIFVLAVASGYLPDLMLARETDAARTEGLIGKPYQEPFVPVGDDARLRYTEIRSHHPFEVAKLRNDFKRAASDPKVQEVLAEFAEASKRKIYRMPLPKVETGFGFTSAALPYGSEIEADLALVGQALAMNARDEAGLRAAARVARHVQEGEDPTQIPSLRPPKVANATLDAADRLGIPGSRLASDLGETDPVAQLRNRVIVLLARPTGDLSVNDRRRRSRFIAFWRGFLKRLPHEPDEFVRTVTEAEPEIVGVENGLNVGYRMYGSVSLTPKPWHDWAVGAAKVAKRLGR